MQYQIATASAPAGSSTGVLAPGKTNSWYVLSRTARNLAVDCAAVVNAAGLSADVMAERAGLDVDGCGYRITSFTPEVTALKAMSENRIGPAKNCDKIIAGCKLNIASEPRQKQIRYALCCSYTFGGQTAAVVVKNYDQNY